MGVCFFETEAHKRRSHNTKVLKKMQKGESLAKMNSMLSWYPPRPVVKKDKYAIHKLYGILGPSLRNSLKLPVKRSKLILLTAVICMLTLIPNFSVLYDNQI